MERVDSRKFVHGDIEKLNILIFSVTGTCKDVVFSAIGENYMRKDLFHNWVFYVLNISNWRNSFPCCFTVISTMNKDSCLDMVCLLWTYLFNRKLYSFFHEFFTA